MGIAAEQLLNGLNSSYVPAGGAAVPVLGRADEHRQHVGPAAALLQRAGRPLPRRARPRQHRAERDLRRHVRLGHRRRRGHGPGDDRHDDAATGAIPPATPPRSPPPRRSSGRSSRRRSRWCSTRSSPTPPSATCSSAASSPACSWRPPRWRHRPGREAPELPGGRNRAGARMAEDHRRGVPGADDAGHPARRHLQRRHDADRGGRDRRRLRLPHLAVPLSQRHGAAYLHRRADQRPLDRLDRHADRRRAGLQLRRHDREHPAGGEGDSWRLRADADDVSGSSSTSSC